MAGKTGSNGHGAVVSRSAELFRRASEVLPGGNTRTTIFFRPHPPYAEHGQGAWIWDVDGVRRLDLNNNYTSLLHGHCHPHIVEAIRSQAGRLLSASLPTESEVALAETLCARSPAIERVRFTNSGSEAVMMAVKAARAFTGRPRIAKVEGAYHGSFDSVEVSLDSRPETWGTSPPERVAYCEGTPQQVLDNTVVIPLNQSEEALAILESSADSLAAVIIDPAPTRIGLIQAEPAYLAMLRDFCDRRGCLLIFDEVIAYRIAFGGAHVGLGIRPDLITLGKTIGGGLPIGAVAGAADPMSVFEDRNRRPRVPHGGTFNANPMSMTAGLAAMELFEATEAARLDDLALEVQGGLERIIARLGLAAAVQRAGSMFRTTLSGKRARTYREFFPDPAQAAGEERLFRSLMANGVLIGRNLVGALSTPMGAKEVSFLLDAYERALTAVAEG